jgi:hypothetical protein
MIGLQMGDEPPITDGDLRKDNKSLKQARDTYRRMLDDAMFGNEKLREVLRDCMFYMEPMTEGLDPNEWPKNNDGEPDPLFETIRRAKNALRGVVEIPQ